MTKHDKRTPSRVRIGGKMVPVVAAALMGQEADRCHVAPSRVGEISIPDPPPTHVEIAGNTLTLWAAAWLASVADAQGVEPSEVIATVVEEHFLEMKEEEDEVEKDAS